jgi:hypothetical protein
MYIAIDSAENMIYTGVISGSLSEIWGVYNNFIEIFKKRGVNPPFHWRKISRRVKDSCMNEIVQAINNSKLVINVFKHERAPKMERKIMFYELLPQHISFRISPWVKELAGKMEIEVDDDYRLSKADNTKKFLKALIENMCFILTGTQIYSRKEDDTIKATIKQKNGILNFYGNVVRSNDSKGVQIMDLILGYFIQSKCRDFNRNKLHYWTIFKR